MAHDDHTAIRQQFNRRFLFGLHAAFSGVISIVLFVLVFTHPLNIVARDDQLVWAGYARPDLMYLGSILLGFIGLHGLWLLRHEGRLLRRRSAFSLHALLTAVCFALTFSYFESWYAKEVYKWVDYYLPVSPGSPPEAIVSAVLLLTILTTLALPIHGIWLLYTELLTRALRGVNTKQKRDETAPLVGDDGELPEWVEEEIKAKCLSSIE